MQELQKKIIQLKNQIDEALKAVTFEEKYTKLQELERKAMGPGFWDDSEMAQKHMQQKSKLHAEVDPWQSINLSINELNELVETGDESLLGDLEKQYIDVKRQFSAIKKDLRFTDPFDSYDVLISIHAGAGGTDAQDWTQMLLRMYTRWAEANTVKITILEESAGDEAGIKSVSFELSGPFIYGMVKAEHGVHRLVRLSPFNANNLRQTSFAKVEVLPKIDAPDDVPIDETELKIDVFRAGGHGGQSVNTTDSAVRITHLPTGIVVSIQNERSQLQNKETAMTILRSKLAQLKAEQHLETMADIKGPNQSAEWGSQIRSYVLHPYTMVKDLRTRHETSNAAGVLDGDLNPFIEASLEQNLSSPSPL